MSLCRGRDNRARIQNQSSSSPARQFCSWPWTSLEPGSTEGLPLRLSSYITDLRQTQRAPCWGGKIPSVCAVLLPGVNLDSKSAMNLWERAGAQLWSTLIAIAAPFYWVTLTSLLCPTLQVYEFDFVQSVWGIQTIPCFCFGKPLGVWDCSPSG